MNALATPGKSLRPRWANQKQISRPCGIVLKMTATEHHDLGGLYDSLPKKEKHMTLRPLGFVQSSNYSWIQYLLYDVHLLLTVSLHFPVTLLASCLSAFTLTVIVSNAAWLVILFPSRRDRDRQRGCLRQRRHPHHFIDLQVGLLQYIDHIAQLYFYLTSNRCKDWQVPTHTSTSWHPLVAGNLPTSAYSAYSRRSR